MDGLADDYECQHEELPQMLNKGKAVLYVPGLRNSEMK